MKDTNLIINLFIQKLNMRCKEDMVLVTPVDKSILFKNKKVVYFADSMLSMRFDTQEEECKEAIEEPLHTLGIRFHKIECTTNPPFGKMDYDILFFDYGGMSIGNSLMQSFCRQILMEAKDYPSRYYVMVSSFTERAMRDIQKEYGTMEEYNIYLKIEDFAQTFLIHESE